MFGNLPQEQLGWFNEQGIRYLTMDELANSERQRADRAQIQVDELLAKLQAIEENQ